MRATSAPTRRKLTPPQIAKMWGVDPWKVIKFIRSGELKAINVATNLNGPPRFLVDEADLQDFERRRSVVPPVAKSPRKKPASRDVTAFFA